MPATIFTVRWPDGGLEACYSPSTIVRTYFEVGRAYSLAEFLDISRRALHAASERVRLRYGSGCTRAMAQLAAIEATARRHTDEGAQVHIEGFR